MLAIVLFGLLGFASAAPRFPFSDESSLESMFNDEMFSMKNFWRQFSRDMMSLEDRLSEISRNIPHIVTSEGIEGNEYKIEIPLTGFQERDISVKAKNGLLKVVAQHNYGPDSTSNYVIVRSLPNNIGVNGNWTFSNGLLQILFPVNSPTNTEVDTETAAPNHSREEIEPDSSDNNMNADIEVHEVTPGTELLTNEIPKSKAEGSKYSESSKNDYEFVPLSQM